MSESPSLGIFPKIVKLKKKERKLFIEFDNGFEFDYSAEYLRVESPSAEIAGQGSSQKIIPSCRKVNIDTLETIGTYAVRIVFSDHHDTGIYSWDYLYTLGQTHQEKWNRYLKILEALGLSRD